MPGPGGHGGAGGGRGGHGGGPGGGHGGFGGGHRPPMGGHGGHGGHRPPVMHHHRPYHMGGWGMHRPHPRGGCCGCMMPVIAVSTLLATALLLLIF